MKKYTTIFILFLFPMISFAQVRLNEFMYDVPGTDSKREWIEVYNGGEVSVDLSEYFLIESGKSHGLNIFSGVNTLSSGDFAIIASDAESFMIDHPEFSGNLFDSVFSLNNTGETIELSLSGEIIDSVNYNPEIGGKGDGSTLQFYDGVWIASEMTPGVENKNTPIIEESNEETEDSVSDNKNISSHNDQVELSFEEEKNELSVGVGRERSVILNSPIKFKAISNSNSRNKFFWSLGDGSSKEGKEIEHYYKYPGNYTLILQGYNKNNKAVTRTKIKVINPEIELDYIESGLIIKNKSNSEINVGEFTVEQDNNEFKLSENTIIDPDASIGIPFEIFNFDVKKCKNISLYYPNHKLLKSFFISDNEYNEITPENVTENVLKILKSQCSIDEKLSIMEELS